MIDDNKIEAAKEEIYEDRFLLNGEEVVFDNDAKEEMFYKEDIKEAIGLGAKWAINEFLKDLWHPVSEEPEENKKLLVQYTNYMVEDDYEIDMNIPHVPWRYLVTTYNFKKWCYIEDLLPKGGEK